MRSNATAAITVIDANAKANAYLHIMNATNTALTITQQIKAELYSQFIKEQEEAVLSLNSTDFLRYMKINALRTHQSQNLTIGFDTPF